MAAQQNAPPQIQLTTADEMSRGRFSNTMVVAHSPEEFILDWLLMSPNGNHLVSRIVVTPGHIKRIIAALTDNLKRYEQKFGGIRAIEPSEQKFN
jgi:hypothetical protein